jgi:predicted ATPase
VRDDLPNGTVTFVLTDVEGSTRLLHELGAEAYAEALGDHRDIVRRACSAEGGVEVDTQGDAFFFVFASAPGAAAAARAVTEALAPGRVRLRIGLHTGTAFVTEEGYVGDDVHLAARIAASGHGGQILLSASTRELLDGSVLTDLGEHRFKDIEGAVSIFQLGDTSFPPLKTISNTNLPRPASSFVGRAAELEEVLALLEDGARLLTLTGPGGSGKTRLALEAAATLVTSYKAGVFWVGLASLHDASLVTETIAQTIGSNNGLAEYIGEREMLLLLDNLEHVIEAAPEVSACLTACPNLALLVTSRELLRVQGEVEYEVPPLASADAVSLFCERSRLEPSSEIAELCARLDDLPLAVELAAARTKALSPRQILDRLGVRLDELRGGRDADPRHQTLRATIEWSYELLSPEEQRLFRSLAVFAGGCTLEAAEDVAAASLDALQSLVEKSLLRFSNERYWMLETIREYASEQLLTSSAAEETQQCHASYFMALAESADEEWLGARHHQWLNRLEMERQNLRAAVSWAFEVERPDLALRLTVGASRFWMARGPMLEGLRWLEDAIRAATEAPLRLRAAALRRVAAFRIRLGDAAGACQAADASLLLYRESGNAHDIAMALEEVGDPLAQLGEVALARQSFSEALDLLREHGSDLEIARVLISIGYLELAHHDYDRAVELFEGAAARIRRTSRPGDMAYALVNLGSARLARDDIDAAEADLHESWDLYGSVMDPVGCAYAVEALAVLKARRLAHMDSAALFGAADRMFKENGVAMQSFELALHETTVAALEDILGRSAFADAWSRGAALTDDEIAAIIKR